ncbi:hypothetical protein BVY12_22265, partial [Pseudomonas amygdali pv. morsprunorum]
FCSASLSGSTVEKNLILNGNISGSGTFASGEGAKGISLEGGRINGNVINHGLVEVSGQGATPWTSPRA